MMRALAVSTLSCVLFLTACSSPTVTQSGAPTATSTGSQTMTPPACDATYETASAGTSSVMRSVSDGKGHMRTETTTPQGKVVSIIDYPNSVMWSLIEAQKMAMKLPFDPNAGGPAIRDAQSAEKFGAKPLGVKVIDGHPCHGWQTTVQGTTSESWVGDDINTLVYSVSKGSYGESSMHLKSYSAAQPDPSLFTVPPDYTVTTAQSGTPPGM